MKNKIRVAIAEDYELERLGIISLLREFPDIEVVHAAANGYELLEGFRGIPPDIVLLDIEMKVMDGRRTLRRIRRHYPKVKVIMLTEHFTEGYIVEFISNGASAFMSKNYSISKLVEAIRQVYSNGQYIDPIVTKIMHNTARLSSNHYPIEARPDLNLTPREVEFINFLCAGKSTGDIAKEMKITRRTAEGYSQTVYSKTRCETLIDLITFAFKNNIISI